MKGTLVNDLKNLWVQYRLHTYKTAFKTTPPSSGVSQQRRKEEKKGMEDLLIFGRQFGAITKDFEGSESGEERKCLIVEIT